MQRKMKHPAIMITAVVFLGLILRSPIAAVPVMLAHIAGDLHVPLGNLGILTSIPLFVFAVISSFTSVTLRLLGLQRAFLAVIITMTVGGFLRLGNYPMLLIGTALIGLGIAHLNVLLPSLVTAYFSNRIGVYTSLYTFTMMVGVGVFQLLAAPIATAYGYRTMMGLLAAIVVLALLSWALAMTQKLPDFGRVTNAKKYVAPKIPVWTNRRAWAFLFLFAGQAVMNYTILAWLPTMTHASGLSLAAGGIAISGFSFCGLPISLIVPNLIPRLVGWQKTGFQLLAGVLGIIPCIMLFFPVASLAYWLTISVLFGLSVNMIFVNVMTLFSAKTNTPFETAKLSGMAQSGGYLIASAGPVFFGYMYESTGSWNIPVIAIAVVTVIMVFAGIEVERHEKVFN